jgi:DNA-binding transcriptional ArsR family regulator
MDDISEPRELGLMIIPRRHPHPYDEGFVQIRQAALLEMARDKTLGIEARRLFEYLLAVADHENKVIADAKAMSDELDMALSSVYRALKALRDRHLIEKHPRLRRISRINPQVAWKGSAKRLREELGEAA